MTPDEPQSEPDLPPLYSATALRADLDPFKEAVIRAQAGDPAGTFLWARRPDCIDFAVILEPDRPRAESLPVCLVAMVAMLDALGGVIEPSVAVTFGWPDRIDVNGALAGGLRFAAAPGDAPDWIVIAITIAVTGDLNDDSPGLNPDRTTLLDEGCGVVDVVDVMGRFGRHFMAWINRWREDGLDPVRQAWLARESGFGGETGIYADNRRIAGRLAGLDDCGGAILEIDGTEQVFPLEAALQSGSWSRGDLLVAWHAVP